MTNKRVRQKRERQRLMPGKSLEGFEKNVLQVKEQTYQELIACRNPSDRVALQKRLSYWNSVHEDIRKFYFDL